MWNEDCKDFQNIVNSKCDDVATKALEVPYLHSKYLNYYYELIEQKNELDVKIMKLKKDKRHFYEGRSDAKTNIVRQFNVRLKTEVEKQIYIDGDDDYVSCTLEIKKISNLIEYVKQIIDQINKFNYLIKCAIEWYKFSNGE